jgi:hypothetical protein
VSKFFFPSVFITIPVKMATWEHSIEERHVYRPDLWMTKPKWVGKQRKSQEGKCQAEGG